METIYYASLRASVNLAKERFEGMKILCSNYQLQKINLPEYYDSNLKIEEEEINKLYHELKPCKWELEQTSHYGSYSNFEGSPFSQGKFQQDLYPDKTELTFPEKWEELRSEMIMYGTRNSLLTALMPTASTSQILGANECFEPCTNNIYTRKTTAGDFPIINKYLVKALQKQGLWSEDMKNQIIENDGSVQSLLIPQEIKDLFKTVWEIKQIWLLKHAVARAKFVDQAQSMNIFMAEPDNQRLTSSHFWGWKNGLKTGQYYLRSKPATQALKFSLEAKPISISKSLGVISSASKESISESISEETSSSNEENIPKFIKQKKFRIFAKEEEVCTNCSS